MCIITMKNISVALTLGILLISAAILTSFPRDIVAQEKDVDYSVTLFYTLT